MHDATHAQPSGKAWSGKFQQLEGLRGIAAVTVVVWHFLWAFAPWQLGSVAGWPSQGLAGDVIAALCNGPAAVAVFFVLSGFVIPLRFFRSGDALTVVQAAAKRWPRLAGLSVLAVVFAYVLLHFGLFHYQAAGRLTGSDWLASYGGGAPAVTQTPSLTGAIREGLVGAFINKSDAYDPVLWTMRHELLGSFLSLAVALVIRRVAVKFCGVVLLSAAALAALVDPWLLPFVAGTGLAFVVWTRKPRLGGLATATSAVIGVFLFGYLEPIGAYAAIPMLQDAAGYRYDRIILHTISGLLLILALVGNDRVGRLLSVKPLLLLGRLSFPVYLFHFPLLCSFGCGLFVLLRHSLSYPLSISLVAVAFAPTVLLTGALLTRVDDVWGALLNHVSNLLVAPCVRGSALRHAARSWLVRLRAP